MTRLIVVTLLLAAVAIVLKLRNRNNTTNRAIKVTSRVTVSRGSMIAVVEIDGRRLLIGAAPNQVNLIAELADVSPVDPTDTSPTEPRPSAAAALARLTAKRTDLSTESSTSGTRRTAGPARRLASGAPRSRNIVEADSGSLVDRVRRMTARTVEPKLRMPNQTGGTQ